MTANVEVARQAGAAGRRDLPRPGRDAAAAAGEPPTGCDALVAAPDPGSRNLLGLGAVMGGGVEDGSGPVLIGTKLRPPVVRDQVVPRERLFKRLRAGAGLALSLVAGPAGYGKTTLLAAWREAEAARKPVAWLTLDEGDNDPVVLWSYVIEALRRACPALSVPAPPRLAGAASIVRIVLPRLVNELDDQGEVTLILDDVPPAGRRRGPREPGLVHRSCAARLPARALHQDRAGPSAGRAARAR